VYIQQQLNDITQQAISVCRAHLGAQYSGLSTTGWNIPANGTDLRASATGEKQTAALMTIPNQRSIPSIDPLSFPGLRLTGLDSPDSSFGIKKSSGQLRWSIDGTYVEYLIAVRDPKRSVAWLANSTTSAFPGSPYSKDLIAVYFAWFTFCNNTMRENAHGETDPR
jgi:hypothetical protein